MVLERLSSERLKSLFGFQTRSRAHSIASAPLNALTRPIAYGLCPSMGIIPIACLAVFFRSVVTRRLHHGLLIPAFWAD